MAYTVKYTDFANKGAITVNDSTMNTETPVTFPGRNERGYSVAIAENFLHLLENFANTVAPANPIEGQLWYDTSSGVEDLKVYDGTTWKSSGSIRKGVSTPDVGVLGDLWVDTDNQQLFLFNGASWVLVGPTFSTGLKTGVVPELILDSNEPPVNRVVLKTYIDDQVLTIYSLHSFVPKTGIEGFPTINSGINISTKAFSTGSAGNKYWGVAEKAEGLIIGNSVVAASNFLRKDVANITNYGLTIRNDLGLLTGSQGQLKLTVDTAGIANIYHSTPDSAFDIRINKSGAITTVIRADSNGNIGINTLAPSYNLDVYGTSRFTDTMKIEGTANVDNTLGPALQVSGGATINQDLDVKGSLTSGDTSLLALTVGGTGVTQAILPLANNVYDIGKINNTDPTASRKFANIYATTFHGTLAGNATGSAAFAYQLTSPTRFSIDGDVTAPYFSFDGSVGGTEKVFTTTVSSNFIDNKDELTDVSNTDELLVYRPGLGKLTKMYRTTFFQQVPLVPIGTILPFAGIVLPPGYLFCDGSEKSRATYADLFAVIGYTYGDPGSLSGIATFRVPDLRGKFALGLSTMDNADSIQSNTGLIDSNTNQLSGSTQGTAGVLGNSHGNDSVTLEISNLPNHKHDFIGDAGTRFYATNNTAGTPTDTGALGGNGPSAAGQGQYFPTTGNMIGASTSPTNSSQFQTTAVDIMNPYLTINYIIFSGKFS